MSLLASPIVPLAEANRRPGCGTKAAVLARIISAGFDVPPGFVVTSDVFLWHMGTAGLADADPRTAPLLERDKAHRAVLNLQIDPEIWDLVVCAYENLVRAADTDEPKLVARPSTDPHLPAAYESAVDISSLDELRQAIKRVWASVWTERAVSVLRRHATQNPCGIAVLVQLMVPLRNHGLTVTANPLTGNPHQVVTFTDGTCRSEILTLDLRSLKPMFRGSNNSAPPAAELSAEQAILIEEIVGSPAEIEWAYNGGRLWILQAQRSEGIPGYFPTTVNFERGEYYQVTPKPVSPLIRGAIWQGQSPHATKLPVPNAREEHHILNGYIYRCSPRVLQEDSFLKEPRVQEKEIRNAEHELRRTTAELPSVSAKASELLNKDLKAIPTRELINVTEDALSLYRRTLRLLERTRYPSERFPRLLREFLGSGSEAESAYQQLIASTSEPFVVRDAALQDLADRIAAARSTSRIDDSRWRKDFRQEVENFAREHCYVFQHAGEAYDPASWKSWVEDPDILFRIIAALARRGTRASVLRLWEARKAALPRLTQEVLNAYSGRAREHLSRLITQSLGWLDARGRAYDLCARAGTAFRLSVLELGDRFTSWGLLLHPEDVFYLRLDECVALGSRAPNLTKNTIIRTIADRKHRTWLEERLQAPEKLPADAETNAPHSLQHCIKGRPCSPGAAQGRILIANSLPEACAAEPGHIITTSQLAPAWTPLLGVACGFVSKDSCETTIAAVAALYGTPVVSNCAKAAEGLSTNELVFIDGVKGTLQRIES
ncbi:MAG: PEP/pyruvate-binding domain-containing protein [Armatimonadota bacterium]|nr:PEP/pyruvate-binding domain-containing protein [Armatimonadota bacterium]